MKILHTVQFYEPSVGGMQEVVRQLSERLAAMGHSVTVATSKDGSRRCRDRKGVKIEEFDVSGNYVNGITGESRAYEEFLGDAHFDIVTNFAAQQWATDLALPMLGRIKGKKVFVPTGFPALEQPRYECYFDLMRGWIKDYDASVFLAEKYRDIDYAREHGARRIVVIPNGAGEDEFLHLPEFDLRTKLGIPKDHMLVLHVGSHTELKGHEELLRIFARARIRDATLLLIGNDLFGKCLRHCRRRERLFKLSRARFQDNKRFQVRSVERVDTLAAFREADIFLFPSWLECSPLVIFECLASRTPFLSTDVGNVQEIIEKSCGGQLLPGGQDAEGYTHADVEESTGLLAALAQDEARRKQMAESGYQAWQRFFTWERIAKQYESLYQSLLAT